ncbi:MAG: hypothetical protein ACUVWS_17160 [Roseiflexus sp.]
MLHCQKPSGPVRGAPRSILFLCHLIPGFDGIAPPYAVGSIESPALTFRAVYDCVAAPDLAIAHLLPALVRYPDGYGFLKVP